MTTADGLSAALVLRIGAIAATVLVSRRTRVARQVAFLGAGLASIATFLTAAHVLRTGTALHGVWLVHQASGFVLTYTVDGLSAWFLAVLSVTAVPIATIYQGLVQAKNLHGVVASGGGIVAFDKAFLTK